MNRNHFWKLVFILLVLVWAIAEIYPPSARPLLPYFRSRAVNTDATFQAIFTKAQAEDKDRPLRTYANIQDAIGTNDITKYFPMFEAKNEVHPTTYILNRLQREAAGHVKLGIDLAGGTSFLVEMNTNSLATVETVTNKLGDLTTVTNYAAANDVQGALSQAVEVLRKRVDKFGVAEPVIQPQGNNQILIELPGLSEEATENARVTISKVAYLEFRIVHQDSQKLIEDGRTTVPGYELMTYVQTSEKGTKQAIKFLVKRHPEMVGGIKGAYVTRDNLGRPQIDFTLDSASSSTFAKLTKDNQGRLLAIVLDGELPTYPPRIDSPIETGNGVITGNFTEAEAFSLANVLENPLKAPVRIVNERRIDPTLGKDTIHSGIQAAIIGVIAVAGFMLIYYLVAGMVANVALMLNIIILLGVMCSIGTTLTMPGIAGVVLTIGMAVDANVLIFERIREESAKGKSMRGALKAGYDRAFGTIFDSHVTTLISSIILIFMGTGPVKGFGVTLTIGVAASLFTALVVTRLIFDWLLAKNILKSLKMFHLIRATKLDFMKLAVPAFVASWLLILIGNVYGIAVRGHKVFGVEFVGGETITLNVDQAHKPPVDKIRDVAQKTAGGEVLVAYQHNISEGTDTLRVTVREFENSANDTLSDKVFQALLHEFPDAGFGGTTGKPAAIDRVGPTVGQEIQKTAVVASLLAMFGILVYVAFRYEFSFAIGAVVAIIHDVLMTLGCYFLSGRELNATTVAAVLTIIGFSINDTIVIFDRIREDLKMGVRGTFREVMNQALNQTLSRTLITSGTVFLATMSLYIFGGGVINDFAFTFLIGILTGTYSSIYIASALVLWWHKGQRPNIGSGAQAAVVQAESAVAQR